MHTAGVYDAAVPGIVGLLLINLSLRSKTKAMTLGWIMISLPLFLHQFLTYGRGLWLGCLAGLVVSVLVFAGVGRGSAARWRQVGLVVGMLSALGVLGAVGIAVMSGETDVLLHAGSRFGSITETSTKTGSNIFRLVEYSLALKHIAESPWIGHGIGYTFLGMSAVGFLRFNQWYVHQDFLFVWLKQGIVGLALFVWLIAGAITLGVREARRREDPWESTWFAATAAATVHLTVFALSNFPFGQVNPIFTLALLWGGAMGMTRNGFVRFQWSTPEATAAAG